MSERFQLALLCPRLDGEGSAARFWSKLLPYLQRELDVTVFGAADEAREDCHSVADLHPRRFGQVLYAVDDVAECGYMARAIRAIGGTVDLFSWELPGLAVSAWPELGRGGGRSFLRSVREGGLAEALAWHKNRSTAGRCFNRSIVRHGDAFIVREDELGARIRAERNENTAVGVVRHPELEVEYERDRTSAREELGLPADWNAAPVVAWFSPLHPRKRELLVEAVELVAEALPGVRMLGVGRPNRAKPALHLVESSETWRVLRACDVAVHLPHDPSHRTGEVHEALIHGRCVVTSQVLEHAVPEGTVRRCEAEPRAIADQLLQLLRAPELRLRAEQDAFRHMHEERRWQHVAQLYAQFLEAFPAPRAARKSLIAARLREVERRSAKNAEQ